MTNLILTLHLVPLAGALLLFLFPKKRPNIAGIFAAVVALYQFIYTLVNLNYSTAVSAASFFGVDLSFNFDKLSAAAILVISGATFLAVLYSLSLKLTKDRSPLFYSLILMVLFATTGVALASDLIQFYVFWEAMLIPAWLLVIMWNDEPAKSRFVGLKFFIITHIGAVMMLASILWMYSKFGTTSMNQLAAMLTTVPKEMITIIAILFLMGFLVKLAIFPFHTWLPDSYTTSSMPVTLVLVGVLTNIGVYGITRFMPFFPYEGTAALVKPLMVAALINMFYGGTMAFVEKNSKRLVAYSSISQMGYVLLGLATFTAQGFAGSYLNIFNQAATKLALFMALGLVYEFSNEQNFEGLGGLAKRLPFSGICAVIAVLSLVGAPPMLGFWPEFLTFSGVFSLGAWKVGMLGLAATVISAAYGLRLVKLVYFGKINSKLEGDVVKPRFFAGFAMFIACAVIIVFGFYPSMLFNIIREAIAGLGFILGAV